MNLEGWHLTDTPTNLVKWRFPSLVLAPGAFQLVFASGKDRAIAGAQLHTNFKLDGDGEYLALVRADGATVESAFSPAYPSQTTDISFGWVDEAGIRVARFFAPPTPGTSNGPGFQAVALPPVASPAGGFLRTLVEVSLSPTPSDAEVRYTLDGSVPNESSTRYSVPIQISGTRLLRARTFVPGLAPSPITGAAFTKIGSDVGTFSSDLPIAVLNTFSRTIADSTRNPAYLDLLSPEISTRRTTLDGSLRFVSRTSIEMRGSSSAGFEKKSYGFELQDEAGTDLPASLLEMPADSDWVLYAPYTDKTLIRDVLAYELSRRIGRYAPRTRFVELFVNRGNTDLQMADYQGVYVVIEKVKIAPGRVDVAVLEPDDLLDPDITGGYLLKRDRFDANDQVLTTTRGVELGIEDPKRTQIGATQRNWIRTWLNQMESALYGTNWRDPVSGYRRFLEPDSFIDHHWLVEAARNIDGYRLSTFWFKDRAGRLNMGPIWDYNLSFGNADYLDGWLPSGWYYQAVGDSGHTWLSRLLQDSDYQQRRIDRWFQHRAGPFATTNVVALIDSLAGQVRGSQARNFNRWKILGQYVWPNWYVGNSWQEEIDWMRRWTTNRFAWIDRQFIAPPSSSHPGGPIPDGITLTLRPATGTLYYTLDGTDPRLAGGGIASYSRAYTGPVTLASNAFLVARSRTGANWSAPFRAPFIVQTPTLTLTEVMFHPSPAPPGSPPGLDPEELEFVELKNFGPTEIPLAGVHLEGDIQFRFPGDSRSLLPGEHVVVARNPAAFTVRHGAAPRVAGPFAGELPNGQGTLSLVGSLEEPILTFTYNDDWYPSTDGRGYSLTVSSDATPAPAWGQPANWRPSLVVGGTPGRANVVDRGAPVLLDATRGPSGLRLRFQSNPGAGLLLQRRSSLDEGTWTTLIDVLPPSGPQGEISDPAPPVSGTAFYRLVTPR